MCVKFNLFLKCIVKSVKSVFKIYRARARKRCIISNIYSVFNLTLLFFSSIEFLQLLFLREIEFR